MRTFRKFVRALAAGAFIALAPVSIGSASADVCSHIEDDVERRQCLSEETERIIFELQVHVCARELTKNALATLGLEMGFTATTTAAQIVTAFSAHPERQEQRLEQALNKAARPLAEVLYYFVVMEDENENKALKACVDTLSDGEETVTQEREKAQPPEHRQPVDLDWLDDVMAELDEPPETEAPPPQVPPERIELGVDCSKPLTVSLPDDVLTECE